MTFATVGSCASTCSERASSRRSPAASPCCAGRDSEFTWREALAWLSWGITLALAIGSIVDTRRASRGHLIADDSPVHGDEAKLLKKRLRS